MRSIHGAAVGGGCLEGVTSPQILAALLHGNRIHGNIPEQTLRSGMKAQGPPRSSEPARGAPALPSSRRNCPARSRPEAAPGGSGKDSASRQSWRRRPGSFLTCEPTINYSPESSSGSSEPAPPNPNQLLLRLPRAHSQCSRAVGGCGGRSLLSPGRLLGFFGCWSCFHRGGDLGGDSGVRLGSAQASQNPANPSPGEPAGKSRPRPLPPELRLPGFPWSREGCARKHPHT